MSKRLSPAKSFLVIQSILLGASVYRPSQAQLDVLADSDSLNKYLDGFYAPRNEDCTIFCQVDCDLEVELDNEFHIYEKGYADTFIDLVLSGNTSIPYPISSRLDHSITIDGSVSEDDFNEIVEFVLSQTGFGNMDELEPGIIIDIVSFIDPPVLASALSSN